jgi:hypothetical protein
MEGLIEFPAKVSVPTGPPRFVSSLASCRLGDWQRPELVLEWWGRGGVQRFQPPDRFECFDNEKPMWLFERCPHPAQRAIRGIPCAIWKRIA